MWFILVPRAHGVTEIYELSVADQNQLIKESSSIALYLKKKCLVDKVNIGALGNIVSQLHIHVVGRTIQDVAWPGPVWGNGEAEPYSPEVLVEKINLLRDWLRAQKTLFL